ncbi:MAG: methionyl-tRNA formyltransferase [Proteobacteria bacterium]|nr:methionyl-tRNA formyltransferase [Pseudomonadota bacterium]
MSVAPRIVFLGTPEFAVPILHALVRNTAVVLVVSQPDRPTGRGRKLLPPPVKTAAMEFGLPVIQPDIVKGRRFANRIAEYRPDFIVTAAYGRILGPNLLRVATKESLNVHASLLPKYRGAAPVNWAILSGDGETGVSIMRMEEELDAGPVYHTVKTPIGPDETAGALLDRLSLLGAEAVIQVIEHFATHTPEPQQHRQATFAPMLKKSDGVMDWCRSAASLHNHIRGMSPWPSATTLFKGEKLKIHASVVLDSGPAGGSPGTILSVAKEGIDVACKTGVLRLTELQAPGRKRLHAREFLAGKKIERGETFEEG